MGKSTSANYLIGILALTSWIYFKPLILDTPRYSEKVFLKLFTSKDDFCFIVWMCLFKPFKLRQYWTQPLKELTANSVFSALNHTETVTK